MIAAQTASGPQPGMAATGWRLRPETNDLLTLDFLRFAASLGIVYYHLNEFFFAPERRQAIIAAQGFGMFVDLFFIISGYVLAHVYIGRLRTAGDYGKFLWRRVARLYPLHLVVLGINIAIWWGLLQRAGSENAPSFDPLCILHTALLVQEYLDCGSPYSFNGVTWSISIEMGLYVLFPLFMLLALRGARWIGAFSAVTLAVAVLLLRDHDGWGHLPPILRGLTGFSFGIFLFRIRGRLPDLRDRGVVSLVLLLALFPLLLLPAPDWLRMATILALATSAVASDLHRNLNPVVLRLAPLGQLTYAIYIWHRAVILVLMNAIADKMLGGAPLALAAMAVMSVATIFALSYLGYFLIETPARRVLTRITRRRDTKRNKEFST
ncbi:acyltransferase family protein [Celeribacter indicus]|nr:acyltransferase [Celeribacter indicus]SDX01723.1 Peptidoglycan/LPS O-acetylase OafA/YrhL, contains acyltransferase and SGNH-hydrolase domains [Celeribacter indicus]